MQLRQCADVLVSDLFQRLGADRAGIVHDMRDRDLCSDLVRGLPRRRRIEQVDLARGELWMAPVGLSPRQRDHVIALGEKSAGNRRADAGIAAAHDRRVLGYAHLPSHKELDVAEGSIAIDQVDALQLDPQPAVLDA